MHSFEEDNELDFVAKRAAEAFDAPGMANWDKMQLLLEKEMPHDKPKKRLVWMLIPAFLILSIGISWWYLYVDQKIDTKEINSKQIQQQIIQPIEKPSTTFTNGIIPDLTQKDAHSSFKKPTNSRSKITITSTPSLLSQMGETIESNSSLLEKENNNKVSLINNLVQELNQASVKLVEQENSSSISLASNPTSTNSVSNTATANPLEIANTSNIVLKNKGFSDKGFFIGVTGGADISTVHFNYKEDLGYNIGGLIGYRFNKHFSVQTGGIFTQKNYKMNGSDFHAPKGTWVSYFKMETVTGTCDMWEIPLIGTYHFQYNGKGRYFLSLGSSSYFMKKENYSYLYYVNNQTYHRSVSYNSNDQHLFALVHISGGIEKSMGKHLTGIIEPYAKIPMSGVGFGSIELSSFGLNFSLLYKQPKRK